MKNGRDLIKSCVSYLTGDYEPYRIYSLNLTTNVVAPTQADLHFRVNTEIDDTIIITASVDELDLCRCDLWFGERYRRERNFWPLGAKEAKLVNIETRPEARGRGLAPTLLSFAAIEMKIRGFEQLYARIWHNNDPSIRAFTKAGWKYEGFVLQLQPVGFNRRLRLSTSEV